MQYISRKRSRRVLGWIFGVVITAASGAWAQPQELPEAEPNSTCAAAQNLTQAPLPLAASGSLQTPPGTPDIDFYRLAATPGDLVRLNVDGRSVYPLTLEDPLLGVFDSSCNQIATGDDWRGPDPQVYVEVPADGIVVAAITSNYDWDFTGDGSWSGTYRLRAQREATARAITGRIVDVRTGQPLAGVNATLTRCVDTSTCDTAGGAVTDETGEVRFATGLATTEGPLLAGTYRLHVYRSSWQPYESELFLAAEGQEVDLGAISLAPEPVVGAIRGRVVDRVTGEPLAGAWVEIQSCRDPAVPSSCGTIANLASETNGTFQFAGYPDSSWPPPGWFRVSASAEQYKGGQTAAFFVGDGEEHDAGSVGLESNPVRLYLEQGCGEIPSAGGPCNARVRIVNGLPTRLRAEAWSVVQANRNDFGSTSLTTFQAGADKAIHLNPGAAVTVPFNFTVPAGVEDGTTICGQTVVAPRRNRFETFGTRHLFCLTKGVQGFSAVPEAQKHDAVQKVLGRTPPPGRP
jgi:hypothetical protein